MSFDLPEFNVLGALLYWLIIVGALAGLTFVLSMIIAALGGGQLGFLRALFSFGTGAKQKGLPWSEVKQAYARVFRNIGNAFVDVFAFSPRRVMAIGSLTFKEAWRRKALLVFVIFAVLFMFAGWFLTDTGQRADLQVKVHVSFVLKAIGWLILPVALLLSCWGLPDDIKRRSLHTVVTKPVRRSEIILGRMLGYTSICTGVLLVMGVAGYVWIQRQVPERAQDQLVCRVPVYGQLTFLDREGRPGQGINVGDIWEFRGYVEGATKARAVWNFQDISPDVMVTLEDRLTGEKLKRLRMETRFEAFRTHKGNIEKQVYCEMFFTKDKRQQAARALSSSPGLGRIGELISQGDFRGAALVLGEAKPADSQMQQFAAGCRDFADVVRPLLSGESGSKAGEELLSAVTQCADAAAAGDSAKLTTALGTFSTVLETHADELSRRIVDLRVSIPAFEVEEFGLNLLEIDPAGFRVTMPDPQTGEEKTRDVDLFKDIVEEGKLRVEVSCVDAGQFIGAARPDLFIRTPDRHFAVGYAKSIAGIWLMMVLIVSMGVTAGSLLNGPVSTFVVFGLMMAGMWFRDFLEQIVRGEIQGGGVIESGVRMVKHMNPTTDLEESWLTSGMKDVDSVGTGILQVAAHIIPDFRSFSTVLQYLPNGFDVNWSQALLPCVAVTVGYFIPCVFIGYFCLKLRELELK